MLSGRYILQPARKLRQEFSQCSMALLMQGEDDRKTPKT